MNKKIVIVSVVVVLIGVGLWALSNREDISNKIVVETPTEFSCSSDQYYLKISDNGQANVIEFGKTQNPIPSKIYVNKTSGVFTIHHDDQYDPAEQKDHIAALDDCTRDGKNIFELYGRSLEKFEAVVNSSSRGDAPSEI
ncbi:MAG TPA: hypothetical protein VJK53_00860 [Candidatus Paceibacterota bacterium]